MKQNPFQFLGPVKGAVWQGALWMMAAAFFFAAMNGFMRGAADAGLHPFQVAFLRSAFALLIIAPLCFRGGFLPSIQALRTKRLPLHIARGAAAGTAMLFWTSAIVAIPMAEATAISFMAPLFAVIGSALILRETVRARRWAAVIVGFFGVLLILRPGMGVLQPGALYALCAAGGMATAALCIKALSNTEPARRVVFYTSTVLTLISAPFAFAVWRPMVQEFWIYGIFLGLFAVLAQLSLSRAFEAADASLVIPFDYTRLPFVALLGWVVFGEVVEPITWIGAGFIIGGALYVAYRERALANEPTPREPPV